MELDNGAFLFVSFVIRPSLSLQVALQHLKLVRGTTLNEGVLFLAFSATTRHDGLISRHYADVSGVLVE